MYGSWIEPTWNNSGILTHEMTQTNNVHSRNELLQNSLDGGPRTPLRDRPESGCVQTNPSEPHLKAAKASGSCATRLNQAGVNPSYVCMLYCIHLAVRQPFLTGKRHYSFIYSLPITANLWRVVGELEPIPGDTGWQPEYTLDKSPVHHRADIQRPLHHSTAPLETLII